MSCTYLKSENAYLLRHVELKYFQLLTKRFQVTTNDSVDVK